MLALVQFPDAPCFTDGVQAITGCTLGKGNVRILGHGPLSLTLIEQATCRAVRVAARGDTLPSRLPDEGVETFLRRLNLGGLEVFSPKCILGLPEDPILT